MLLTDWESTALHCIDLEVVFDRDKKLYTLRLIILVPFFFSFSLACLDWGIIAVGRLSCVPAGAQAVARLLRDLLPIDSQDYYYDRCLYSNEKLLEFDDRRRMRTDAE